MLVLSRSNHNIKHRLEKSTRIIQIDIKIFLSLDAINEGTRSGKNN